MNKVEQLLDRLKRDLKLPELLAIWKKRSTAAWSGEPEVYRQLGERILQKGAPFQASEVVSEGLKLWPEDVRLRQLQGLALARSGATEQANTMFRQLRREGHTDGETLGILARTHMDFGLRAADPVEKQAQLRQAHNLYHEGYRLAVQKRRPDDAIYTGVNAASTALLLRRKTRARTLAREVRGHCLKKLKEGKNYWAEASLGEAAIVLGEWEEAERRYTHATEVGRGNYGDLGSMRRRARLLLEHLGRDRHSLDRCFGIGRVVLFTGHMIDQPGRLRPRFPSRLEKSVSTAMAERLKKLDAGFGYASAACGSDILFLEAMLARRGEIHIVLPFPPEEFRKASVDIIAGADWGARFERVLKRATLQTVSEQELKPGGIPYEFANIFLQGLASLRASSLDTELIAMAVWDGQTGDGPGGTASNDERWRQAGLRIELIDLAEILRHECPELAGAAIEAPPPSALPGVTDGPAAEPEAAECAQPAASAQGLLSSHAELYERMKVLAVDDDPSVRKLLCEALAALSIPTEIFAAADGCEALEQVARVQPNLVLLDVTMPKIDGIEVCRRLRQDWRTALVPVILLAANRKEEDRARKCLQATDDCVNKSLGSFTVVGVKARADGVLRRAYGL